MKSLQEDQDHEKLNKATYSKGRIFALEISAYKDGNPKILKKPRIHRFYMVVEADSQADAKFLAKRYVARITNPDSITCYEIEKDLSSTSPTGKERIITVYEVKK